MVRRIFAGAKGRQIINPIINPIVPQEEMAERSARIINELIKLATTYASITKARLIGVAETS